MKFSDLKHKFLLIIRDEATLEWKFSFRLSRLNVFILTGLTAILLIFITTLIIAFTPLREYIPGYADVNLDRKVKELTLKADSLGRNLKAKDDYIKNLKNIMTGEDLRDTATLTVPQQNPASTSELKNTKSLQDSIFRKEIESEDRYTITETPGESFRISNYLFFVPLKGMLTNAFNPMKNHYGVDIVSKKDEPVKATLDGIVIVSDWTLKNGHIIAIQHTSNLVSIYKHNSYLLKKEGSFVRAGEAIAIVGNSGELSYGPHLHFELWYNGRAINPKNFIKF